MIVLDSHSKLIEAVPLKTTMAGIATDTLRTLFCTFGLPRTIDTVGRSLQAKNSALNFVRRNGIHHVRNAPYHLQSNGLKKRMARAIEQGQKKKKRGSVQTRLARLFHSYRRTPLVCGKTPAILIIGRDMRSRLDNLEMRQGTTVNPICQRFISERRACLGQKLRLGRRMDTSANSSHGGVTHCNRRGTVE